MASKSSTDESLQSIKDLQNAHEFWVANVGEALSKESSTSATPASWKRVSDASTITSTDGFLENPTPASLKIDLAHYRELFTKLHFSYVEQVTKERFLRAIVADPPKIYTPAESAAYEKSLSTSKAQLKAHKDRINELVEQLDVRGRDLAKRYEHVQQQIAELERLPGEIANLNERLDKLKGDEDDTIPLAIDKNKGKGKGTRRSKSSNQRLPLKATTNLVGEKRIELVKAQKLQISLRNAVPKKSFESEELAEELKSLEIRNAAMVNAAREAWRRSQEVQYNDGLKERGKWHKATQRTLQTMLDVDD